MSQSSFLRLASRVAARSVAPRAVPQPTAARFHRFVSSSSGRKSKDDPYHEHSTGALGQSSGPHEGSSSRTDNQISFEYPPDEDFPVESPVQGRGGTHLKRTLPTFSLEGRVGVVTGGARGLGLVMGQALVASGADLAIVDLNSE